MGVKGKWAWQQKDNRKDPCGDGNVLFFTSVNILVVIFYYSFARYYNWGEPCEGYTESLVLLLMTTHEFTVISIKKLN